MNIDINDPANKQAVLDKAAEYLSVEMKERDCLDTPLLVRQYLRVKMLDLEHEVFYCIFLTTHNHVIEVEKMFNGTLNQTNIYPREVVKRALFHNAGRVIFSHNHPGGVPEPSSEDRALTRTLSEVLALVGVKVLDHFIVSPGGCFSFAECGLI